MKKLLFLSFILAVLLLCLPAFAENPVPGKEKCGKSDCYWCTPMDITNEDAVWKMLCSPITVISGNQKEQYLLRAQPDKTSRTVADVTFASQGVHVLEQLDNGWTKVEVRSSSFSDSTVKAYNTFVTGYVETKLLKEVTPDNSKYALVIDKFTQKCYIFVDGHLYSTLLCSTGKPNASQPYNETMSGEFLIVSAVGDFLSNELVCDMGLRFNRGDLLHQVPYILSENGYQDFSVCEPALGTRASHGCIRVQKKLTPQNTNMTWLWNNRRMNSKLVIWQDTQDRYLEFPANDSAIYVNASGGKTYHSSEICASIAERYLPLKRIDYIQLMDDTYLSLTPCKFCNPEWRPEKIEEWNNKYASDHIIYTDDLDGAYYHWSAFCTLYDKECLPLNIQKSTGDDSSCLLPCPECVEKAQNPTLYYNPSGGKSYHINQMCSSVNKRYLPLTAFEYRELNTAPYASLKACTKCKPPARGTYPLDE